jgi:hypothetical protein
MINSIEVIMPMRGECKYARETMDSLIQDLGNEFSLCIPFSELDNSVKLMIQTIAPDVKVRYIDANGMTLAEGLNIAVRTSAKDFLLRIDADDKVVKGRARQQLDFLVNHKTSAVVGSQMIFIDEMSNSIGQTNYATKSVSAEFGFGCRIAHPSVMVRRSHVIASGNYQDVCNFNGVSLCEDFDLWLRILETYEIHVLDLFLTEYRIHTKQSTQRHLLEIGICSLLLRARKILNDSRRIIPIEALDLSSEEIRIAWRSLRGVNSIESRVWLLELSILVVKNCEKLLKSEAKAIRSNKLKRLDLLVYALWYLLRNHGSYQREISNFRDHLL